MAQAAYKKKVNVSTDGATWHALPCTSPSLDFGSEVLDKTDLETNEGFRARLIGLHDWSVSCDSNYEAPHVALKMVRAAKLARTVLHVQYLPVEDITEGWEGEVVVESYNLSGDVGGLETVGITLQGNGALAVAS